MHKIHARRVNLELSIATASGRTSPLAFALGLRFGSGVRRLAPRPSPPSPQKDYLLRCMSAWNRRYGVWHTFVSYSAVKNICIQQYIPRIQQQAKAMIQTQTAHDTYQGICSVPAHSIATVANASHEQKAKAVTKKNSNCARHIPVVHAQVLPSPLPPSPMRCVTEAHPVYTYSCSVFLSFRVTGACPVPTDLIVRVNVITSNNKRNQRPPASPSKAVVGQQSRGGPAKPWWARAMRPPLRGKPPQSLQVTPRATIAAGDFVRNGFWRAGLKSSEISQFFFSLISVQYLAS